LKNEENNQNEMTDGEDDYYEEEHGFDQGGDGEEVVELKKLKKK